MIILSGVLVVVAIALLVAGIVAGNGDSAQVFGQNALDVIYISIAVSIVSALCLAIGVFLRRRELFGPGVATAPARKTKKGKRTEAAPPARVAADAKATAPGEMTIPAPPVDVPSDALVFVVRGRKRYHLDTCRQLAGRDTEELTYAEAKEEGFSPCTACMPDTALAARAAASAPTSPGVGKKAAGDGPTPPRPGAEPSKNALAGLADPAPERSAPGSFDTTAEIPRTDTKPADPEPPEPAGPTLTDMPVASPPPEEAAKPAGATKPAEAAKPTEKADPAEPEPESPSTGDRPAPAASEDDESPQVRILSGTKRYHRVDCALIQDIGDDADDLEGLSRAEAKSRGCTPCLVCEPDREHARD